MVERPGIVGIAIGLPVCLRCNVVCDTRLVTRITAICIIEIGSVAVHFFVPGYTARFIAVALATTVKGNICHRRHTRNKSFVVAGVEQLAGTAQASIISVSVKR